MTAGTGAGAAGRDPIGDAHYGPGSFQGGFVLERRLPAAVPLRLLRTRQPAGAYPDPPMAEVSLQIFTAGRDHAGRYDVGLGRRELRNAPGLMGLAPAHTACDYQVDGPFELLVVNLPAPWLAAAFAEACPGFAGGDFGAAHEAWFRDGFVQGLAERLWAEAAEGNPLGAAFLEHGALALAAALLRRSGRFGGGGADTASPPPPGARDRRLRRALELVEDRLAEDLSLSDLAGAAALGPRQFLRAFRAATGATPHVHLQARRVERAKALLAGTESPLVEVAFACGFKNQSHFGQAFRRLVGTSPGAYRRERRS